MFRPRSIPPIRNAPVILLVLLLALSASASHPTRAAGGSSEIPEAVQLELEGVLRARAGALLQEKNEQGHPYKRGLYSKKFRKLDEGAFQVTFTRQTSLPEKLVSERFLLTLKKDASGKWAVSDEKLQETFDQVFRDVLGDEKFFRFQKFAFAREGLKITATNGSLIRDTWGGQGRLGLAADDLAYQYEPPAHAVGMYGSIYKGYKKDYARDLIFPPEIVAIECTEADCDDIVANATGLEPATKEQMAAVLRDAYEKDFRETQKDRSERPFSGFSLRPFPDRRFYEFYIKKKNSDHFLSLSSDNFDPKEVHVSVSKLGAVATPFPIFSYYSEKTLASGTSPYDLERRDDGESRFYELDRLDATIEMAIDDPELLRAEASFTLKLKRDLDAIPYRISRARPFASEGKDIKSPRMTINAVELEDGTELTAIQTGSASGQLLLPKTAKAGSTLTVRMQFENRDSIYKLTPSFSYVDRGGWLPFVRFGDMINQFDLVVRVPSKYKVLGIGKEVYQKKIGALTEARFASPSPVVFPSIIFGDYVEAASTVTATKVDGTPIPVRVHLDKTSLADKFPVATARDTVRTETGDRLEFADGGKMVSITEGSLPTIANEAGNALNLYRDIYGIDYPYAKLDLVNDPTGSFYGQAPSSLVYLGNRVFLPRGLTGVMLGGGADLSSFMYSVVAHEVAHQWWGSLVANANDGNYWFVESLAEYSSALFMENTSGNNGKKAYMKKVEEWRRVILDSDMTTSVQDASVLSAPDEGAYQAQVYNKGPFAFHILRMTFGDEKFFAFFKRLAADLKGKEIVTRDIQRVTEESFGGNMDWFFDQWLRGVGMPQFSFAYETRKTEDGKYLVSGKIRQRVLAGRNKYLVEGAYFRGIVPVTVVGSKDQEYPAKIRVDGAETPFQFKVPEEPRDVVFNKYNEMLAYDVLVNRSW